MLEYFTSKKVKQHQNEKHEKQKAESEHAPAPVLTPKDEAFLQSLTSEDASAPNQSLTQINPDNDHVSAAQGETDPELSSARSPNAKAKSTHHKSFTPSSFIPGFLSKKDQKKADKSKVNADGTVTPNEASKENEDISSLLDSLNLSASNNRAFSLSAESQNLVQKFTVILKDLVNGVPTAYDDLVALLDESSDTLQKNYKHLPSYLQKLIKTLPAKLSGGLGPEILATAAAAAGGADGANTKTSGKSAVRIPSLKDLVTKPGAVVGILRAIMNFLKLRWPAFLGTNVLLSLGLFVLLFVLWYCHKRGRETRLAKERVDQDGKPIADGERFEELSSDDDDFVEEAHENTRRTARHGETSSSAAGPSDEGGSCRHGH